MGRHLDKLVKLNAASAASQPKDSRGRFTSSPGASGDTPGLPGPSQHKVVSTPVERLTVGKRFVLSPEQERAWKITKVRKDLPAAHKTGQASLGEMNTVTVHAVAGMDSMDHTFVTGERAWVVRG